MEWEPRFSLGMEAIDRQHRELFTRLSALEHSMQSDDQGEISRMLEFLGRYVVEHFRDEEAAMRASSFPGLEEHRAEHQQLVEAFGKMQAEYQVCGYAPWLTVHVRAVVSEWLQGHILGLDQDFGRYLFARR